MQAYPADVAAVVIEAQAELHRRLRTVRDFDGIGATARGVADRVAQGLLEQAAAGGWWERRRGR